MASKDRVPPKTLKGFRDINPAMAHVRKNVIDTIWSHAIISGFEPIDTPILEYAETLLGTGNQETDKEVYLFEDHGNRKVGLRFDLTIPFSRYVAANLGTMVLPFKKVQIGNSYRGEKPQKGRYREFCQADIDIVGVDSQAADLEILYNLAVMLGEIVPAPFTILIGNRVILSALIKAYLPGLAPGDETKALIAIDKLDKVGVSKVIDLIAQLPGVVPADAQELINVILTKNESGDTDLEPVRARFSHDNAVASDPLIKELDRLEATMGSLRSLIKNPKVKVQLDLKIARGLGYYTGIVFETFIDSLPGFGSISSGGRYNGLISRYSRQEVPGAGGSIGVDRLLAACEELQTYREQARRGVFVAVANGEAHDYAFTIARDLRENGVMVDIALQERKLAQQFKYADRKNYAKVIVVGGDELAQQCFSLKDLDSGQEWKGVPIGELHSRVPRT